MCVKEVVIIGLKIHVLLKQLEFIVILKLEEEHIMPIMEKLKMKILILLEQIHILVFINNVQNWDYIQ